MVAKTTRADEGAPASADGVHGRQQKEVIEDDLQKSVPARGGPKGELLACEQMIASSTR